MNDQTNRVQCIECRIIGAPPLKHSCAEVTLQRAAIAQEQVATARARLLLASAQLLALFGRHTSQEEFELHRVLA